LKAVFLDKDGTLVVNVPRNTDPDKVQLTDGAREAVRMFADAGYRVIVASNQPGFGPADMAGIERRLRELGIALDGFYCCFHEKGDSCQCRKPAAGLLRRAAHEHGVDLNESWMVGDILDDVEAGHRAGCRAVLIDNGNETEWHMAPERVPDGIASDLAEAARLICGET